MLFIYPFIYANICFIYLSAPKLGAQMFAKVISSWWIDHFITMQYPCLLLHSIFFPFGYPTEYGVLSSGIRSYLHCSRGMLDPLTHYAGPRLKPVLVLQRHHRSCYTTAGIPEL